MKSCPVYEPWVFGQSLKRVPVRSFRSTSLCTLCLTCLLCVECLLCSRQRSESLIWANSKKRRNNPLKVGLLFSLCHSEVWRGCMTCPGSTHINGGPGFSVWTLNYLTTVLLRITREARLAWRATGRIKVSDGTGRVWRRHRIMVATCGHGVGKAVTTQTWGKPRSEKKSGDSFETTTIPIFLSQRYKLGD